MNLSTILSFLSVLAPFIEPVLTDIENNEVQPELQKLIATVTNVPLKNFLTGLDQALDQLIKAGITEL